MDDEEILRRIEEVTNAIGAACELVGFLRVQLINKGFTREEAVFMCRSVLLRLIFGDRGEDDD